MYCLLGYNTMQNCKIAHVHAIKLYRRIGSIAPLIINLGSRWMYVVSHIPWSLYIQIIYYPLTRMLG